MIKPPDCNGCILESFITKAGHTLNLGRGFSKPDGKGLSGVVVIGEGLGTDERIDGLPFRPHAQAGGKLEQAFRLVNIPRDQFLLWNLIGCQPPDNKLSGAWYEERAIEWCRKAHFKDIVGGFQPPERKQKVILALGNLPMRVLGGFTGEAANKESISWTRGYVVKSRYGLLVGSYHPSYIRRGNHHLTGMLMADIIKAVDTAAGRYTSYEAFPSYSQPRYIEKPSLDDAHAFLQKVKDSVKSLLTYDIETDNFRGVEEDEKEKEDLVDKITDIQFSIKKGTGIAFPYDGRDGPYTKVAKAILALPNPKAGQNVWRFDNPKLEMEGFRIEGRERVLDIMWMWKSLHPEFDRNLQAIASFFGFPFPWKHEYGTGRYKCADVDAPQWIVPELIKRMKQAGVWKGYVGQIHKIHLIKEQASQRGVPVSEEKWEGLRRKLERGKVRLERELEGMVPMELRNVTPKRKW